MSPIDVLTDLFGSDPVDLHGSLIVDAVGLAQLILDALGEHGYQIVPVDP
jgi:hypothetical protein